MLAPTRAVRWTLRLWLILAAGCEDQAPVPAAATIDVTSLLDSILAVGKSTSLTAAAKDQAGAAVAGLTILWSSSNTAALTVSGTGTVTAVAPGTATISAAVASPPVTGILRMRAVEADLTTVGALAGDAYATALIAAVSASKRTAVQTARAKCASGVSSGGVVAIRQCGTSVAAEAASATDAADKALLGILQLYSDETQRRLGL